jgi:S1-C subfamily serine protease
MGSYEPGHEWPPGPAPVPPARDTGWDYAPPPWPPPQPPQPVRPVGSTGGPPAVTALVTTLLVAALALVGAGLLVWVSVRPPAGPSTAPGFGDADSGQPVGAAGPSGSAASSALADSVAARVDPAVVAINSTFGYQRTGGAGTGIVVSADGEVLTNNHVIDGATRIEVTDQGNGRTYAATVLGYDHSHDLALLRLQGAAGLRTAALGDSSRLAVGQPVVAIGNAGGTGSPVSAAGSITALSQDITASDELTGSSERLSGLIEVNADVQPGDSGGPLADASGRVIGVDTAASAGMRFQGAGGQGYAIPIAQALRTVHQIESGQASATVHVGPTAFLGILLGANPGTEQDQDQDGQGFAAPATPGATVAQVLSGGTAERVGLVAGDTITAVNGTAIDSAATLSQLISTLHPGDQVRLTWLDVNGAGHTAGAPLGAGPPA